MALHSKIMKTMEEADWDLYKLAELYLDEIEEKEKLEAEIAEHVCEND